MSLSDPAPDSFTLELDSVLSTKSKYHPTLAAFNGSLHLKDSDPAFAYLNIPEVKAQNGTESHIDQRVQIADMTEYTKYVMTVLGTTQYSIFLKGRGRIQQGDLPKTSVNYNNEISMKGKYVENSTIPTAKQFYRLEQSPRLQPVDFQHPDHRARRRRQRQWNNCHSKSHRVER